jgi:ribulose-5-phosphate 4-epimerase/fuculose-1-phosphate aldolase
MTEARLRDSIARHGQSLYARKYAHGSSGNISVRTEDGYLVTPTNSCLGELDPARISKLDKDGRHIGGDKPSKEAFLHMAMYQERPSAHGIVHLHSTYCVAVSCMCHENTEDILPPVTAYYIMRIGRLPLLPYFRPGDKALAEAVRAIAKTNSAVLLANHGPVTAGKSLEDAVYNAEELEATAQLFLLLQGAKTQFLNATQIRDLHEAFPS